MPSLDHSAQVVAVVVPFAVLFVGAIVIATLWMPYAAKLKTIEVLRTYAEKGEEPPAGIVEAVARINGPAFIPPRPSRADHLSHFAGSLVLAIGSGGLAWWQAPEPHARPELLMIAALAVAIFFTAAAAARLVAAVATSDGR